MGISNLMNKLHHKDEAAPMPVPRPPSPPQPTVEDQVQEEPKPAPAPQPAKRWGSREVTRMKDDGDGIILEIGEGMSINIPIKRRMSLDDFLKIAERVKRIEELNVGQPSYNEHMGEYH